MSRTYSRYKQWALEYPHAHIANENGATMVEFALALIMIIMIFGAVFDIGLGVHKYAMLKQVTTESTRAIAVRLQTHKDCSYIKTYLSQTASRMLSKHMTPGSVPSWTTQWENAGSGLLFPVFRVNSSITMKCYFICRLIPRGVPIRASSEIVIERRGIGPSGTGCPAVSI